MISAVSEHLLESFTAVGVDAGASLALKALQGSTERVCSMRISEKSSNEAGPGRACN